MLDEAEVSEKAKQGTHSSENRSDASSNTSQHMSGREDSDYDEELEVDYETSISGDESLEVESDNFQPSLNVRIHRKDNSVVNNGHTSGSCGSPNSSAGSDRITRQVLAFVSDNSCLQSKCFLPD